MNTAMDRLIQDQGAVVDADGDICWRFGDIEVMLDADGELTIARDGMTLGESGTDASRHLFAALRLVRMLSEAGVRFYMICEPHTARFASHVAAKFGLVQLQEHLPVFHANPSWEN